MPGALLCAAGLGGPVFALIEQPRLGWSSPAVFVPLIAGVFLLAAFLWLRVARDGPDAAAGAVPRRNFSAGNVETFAMYAGLAMLFFFLILFLQQIGGYTPLQSGLATLPVTVIMFALSRRFGALADRFGPRLFMGGGPLVAACGLLLFQRVGAKVDYVSEVLPGAARVRVGAVDDRRAAHGRGAGRRRASQAGIASGVNNAIARVAGLLGTAAVGAAIVAGSFGSSLDKRLSGTAFGRPARGGDREAKRLPLGRPDVHGVLRAQAQRADEGRRAGIAAQLPPGHGDRRPARRRRRRRGSGGDPQPQSA